MARNSDAVVADRTDRSRDVCAMVGRRVIGCHKSRIRGKVPAVDIIDKTIAIVILSVERLLWVNPKC